MIGVMGRAEALAAVALVVAARQEPLGALRRLALEDPALRTLAAVADRCAAGASLPNALAACRLLGRSDAVRLAGLPPATLAAELKRLAQRAAWPPAGETLARWFPLWAVLAATVPSLVIGAAVALVGGSLYGGVWHSLGLASPTHGPALWWFAQFAVAAVAALMAAGGWWVLRRIPLVRRLTSFSRRLDKAAAAVELMCAVRAGHDARLQLAAWARLSGDAAAVQRATAKSGGDITATLTELGVLPRAPDGRVDWDTALAEADQIRTRSAVALTPWLISVLVLAGLHGFMTWGIEPLQTAFAWLFSGFPPQTVVSVLGAGVIRVLDNAGAAVIAAHLLLLLGWLGRWLIGPAQDWPLVADRMARAIERREDLDHVLRGLRLVVDKPMRRRLTTALALRNPHPGSRLVAAGVVPHTQTAALAVADGADLPTLLRSASEMTNDHGLRAAASNATALMALALLLALIQFYLLVGVLPKFQMMLFLFDQDYHTIYQLGLWATRIAALTLGLAFIVSVFAAWGRRRGWWIACGGWARLARGLVLRRLLASGADEATLARSIGALAPRRATLLDAAAQRGDLPGVLAAAGWPVTSPAALDRAVVADLIARDRRRARFALIARLTLPFLVALPMGMSSIAVTLTLSQLTRAQVGLAAGHPNGSASMNGGSPGMALIFWWTRRCEAQGDAVVEELRFNALPVKPPEKPLPPSSKP